MRQATVQFIKLNVGGKFFSTSRSTLLKHKGSYFDIMLSGGNWNPDANDAYFIDANPERFSLILDFLRTGEFSLEGLDQSYRRKLLLDLDYFHLPRFLVDDQWNPQHVASNLHLLDEKKTVIKHLDPRRFNALPDYLGSTIQTYEPSPKFSVILHACEKSRIGFAPYYGTKNQNSFLNPKDGFYLEVRKGIDSSSSEQVKTSQHYLLSSAPLEAHSVLTVEHDKNLSVIKFSCNRVSLGTICYTRTNESVELYPTVTLYGESSTAMLTYSDEDVIS